MEGRQNIFRAAVGNYRTDVAESLSHEETLMKLASAIALHAGLDQMYRPKDYGAPLVNDHKRKKTVCVDFDGVLCESTGPYTRAHFGKPKAEGLKVLKTLLKEKFDVVILTARKETDLVASWLASQGFPHLLVTNHKVPAICYIDDHALFAKDNFLAEDVLKKVRKAVA